MSFNTHKGIINDANTRFKGCMQTSVTYRSSWEFRAFEICSTLSKMGQIESWASEASVFTYHNPIKEKDSKYYMDLTILQKDDKGRDVITFIEIKPNKETIPPKMPKNGNKISYNKALQTFSVNTAKWQEVDEWINNANEIAGYTKYKFVIWDELILKV